VNSAVYPAAPPVNMYPGTFLYNHYRTSLSIIQTLSSELAELKNSLKIADADFNHYIQEEKEYLLSLQSEPIEETLQFRYVDALQELSQSQ
jgi:predicted class III extradiol MEMO1 family dioxygenase